MYWPEEGGAAYGEFKVDITGKEECPGFTVRKLVISNFKVRLYSLINYTVSITMCTDCLAALNIMIFYC